MKYILKNIMTFFKSEKMVFVLVLVCVVTSSFIINFSYGLYQNYHVVKEEEESDLTAICVEFDNSETAFASKAKVKSTLLSLSDEVNEAMETYYVTTPWDMDKIEGLVEWGQTAEILFCIRDGQIVPSEYFKKDLILVEDEDYMISRDFTEEEEREGKHVALVGDDREYRCSKVDNIVDENHMIHFQGKDFEVVGLTNNHPLTVPFESLEEDSWINMVWFHFPRSVTRSQYDEIRVKMEQNFPGVARVPELDIPEAENYYLYNTIILISVLIAVLAAINFAVLYKYILSKRTKPLAIFRICGCTKFRALVMFLSECMLLAVPVFALTTIIYDRIVLPKLGRHFEYIESAYSPNLYLLIAAIYIVVTFVVLLLMISFGFLRRNIREVKAG